MREAPVMLFTEEVQDGGDCPHCQKPFATSDGLRRHIEWRHGTLYMPAGICPVLTCKGTRIFRHEADSELSAAIARGWGNKAPCPIDQCLTCHAIWEPWPDGTSSDCVERASSALPVTTARPGKVQRRAATLRRGQGCSGWPRGRRR